MNKKPEMPKSYSEAYKNAFFSSNKKMREKATKIINFITNRIPLSWLLLIFITSLIPFFYKDWHGKTFYIFIGGLLGLISTLFANTQYKDSEHKKLSRIHSVISIAILFIGVISMFFVIGKETNESYNSFQFFLATYLGGMFGLITGGVILDSLHKKKEKELNSKKQDIDKWTENDTIEYLENILSEYMNNDKYDGKLIKLKIEELIKNIQKNK